MQEIETRVRELAEPLLRAMGLELWGVRYRGAAHAPRLQVFIESASGITAEICGQVSEVLSPALDAADLIRASYTLEVSSPGLDRELFSPEQLARYTGRRIRVRTQAPLQGRHNFEGVLQSVSGAALHLDDAQSGPCTIAYAAVAQARLVPEFTRPGISRHDRHRGVERHG